MQDRDSNFPKIRVTFLLLLASGITLLFFWVIKGFVLALIMAVVLTVLALPAYRRLVKWLRGRDTAAAALTVLLTVVVAIIPTILFLGVLVYEAAQVSESLDSWLKAYVDEPDQGSKVRGEDQ